mmetsp:Transcript_15032/g.22733  ORF Transcript_15032/g.22733 Transcript_15032/m.22733 type:complete len:200 (-) Transcript_15032:426-1025(-)
MRNLVGVTSSSSSAAMYSTHASRDISIGVTIPVVIPLFAERMLVRAFVLQTFTSRSPGLWWIPTIIPLYTSSPALAMSFPRSCAPSIPNVVIVPSENARSEPLSRAEISPWMRGLYESKTLSMIAVPRVAVNILERKPSIPRVGTRYLTTLIPSSKPISCNSPLRVLNKSITLPEYSSGTRTSTDSHGSSTLPVSSFSL